MDLVAAAEDAGIGGSFHLSDVADFVWDRAHVFAPYNEGLVSQELGFDWSPLSPAANAALIVPLAPVRLEAKASSRLCPRADLGRSASKSSDALVLVDAGVALP